MCVTYLGVSGGSRSLGIVLESLERENLKDLKRLKNFENLWFLKVLGGHQILATGPRRGMGDFWVIHLARGD